jgi:hypothetical protein
VTERQRRYSVQIKGIGEVIYREPERVVIFGANVRDHEVYLGEETVSGTPLTDADRERIIQNLYHELNEVQKARIDFFNADGSPWGQLQGWVATPLPGEESARLRAQEERRRRRREFIRSIFGR